jgi:glycosyltransferase involved in cell wall biosynthesis
MLADLRHVADRLHLGDAVVLLGESPNLRAYMEPADLLLHPSLYEGYPRVVVEAEALGLPVVTVDTPYGREAERKYRRIILVRPFDSGALAKAVLAALGGPMPPAPPYDADDVGKSFETLYHRLLGPPVMAEAPPTSPQDCAEVAR